MAVIRTPVNFLKSQNGVKKLHFFFEVNKKKEEENFTKLVVT